MDPVPHGYASLRCAAVAAAAVALISVAAGPSAALAPDAVPAGAVATAARGPSYERPALDTLAEVVRGDFSAVTARFDPALRRQVSPQVLEQSWAAYQAQFGRYVSHGKPRQQDSGAGTVVSVPLRLAKGPGEFRVTFNGDGHMVGLYFLRAGVPVPA
ncbi:DUF3887 domain-containing protein [Streptomyces sp. NPDC002287]